MASGKGGVGKSTVAGASNSLDHTVSYCPSEPGIRTGDAPRKVTSGDPGPGHIRAVGAYTHGSLSCWGTESH